MTTPFKTKYPFGVQTKRFATIGFHPGLDPDGYMNAHKKKLGPGQYDPKYCLCLQKAPEKSPWTIKKRTEEFSQTLGFKNHGILENRKYMKCSGGPGIYDIPESIWQAKKCSILTNKDFGMTKRFTTLRNNNPGPGSYGKDIAKTTTMNMNRFSTKETFEFDGFVDRFKPPYKPWAMPPNKYRPVDRNSIEKLLSRVVSKRGPYDLFTGPRDGTTIKNHFAPPLKCSPDKYYSYLDGANYLLLHPNKKMTGQFFKANRFPKYPATRMMMNDISTCYRDPKFPGPASYDIKQSSIRILDKSQHAFNDSKVEARPGRKWEISPGPGRYKIKHPHCSQKKRATCVFLSKTGRQEHKAIDYTTF